MNYEKEHDIILNQLGEQHSDAELLEIFPEAKEMIPELIKEYKNQRKYLVKEIIKEYNYIMSSPDEMFRYYWTACLKLTKIKDLLIIDKKIQGLQRFLKPVSNEAKSLGRVSDENIESARNVPIESLLDQKFRRSGNNLVGLCPFHDENTPSFYIYVNENRGWCFGCNKGGNAIDIVMSLHDLSFKEAIQFLIGGQR